MAFRRGEQIALRYRNAGRISWVRPVTVVEDGELSVLYLAYGTRLRRRVRLDGTPIERSLRYEARFDVDWRLGDGRWDDSHTLLLTPHGRAHSLWLFWTPEWGFRGWYVNLQEPLTRTAVGYDTTDNVLDLRVPVEEEPQWKDEHELEAAVRVGRFTPDEAAAIRAEGERVLAERPWPTGWEGWRPPPEWPVPEPRPEWES